MKSQKPAEHYPSVNDEQYRGLFEHMREGFAYCRMIYEAGEPSDFIYLEVNPAFEKLTRLSDVRGRRISEVIPGIRAANPELFEIYGRVTRTGSPEKFETYVDGLHIWFAISVYCPKPEHFVAIFENITDRKQAEEDLRRFQLLAEHSRDIIVFMQHVDGRILEVNTAAVEVYGYSREELLQLSIHELRAPKTQDLIGAQMAQASGTGILFETVHRRKDGTTFPVEVSSQGATIGGVDTLVSIVRDISERKQAEARIMDLLSFTEKILSTSPVGIITYKTTGECIFANENAAQIVGATIEQLTAQNFRTLESWKKSGLYRLAEEAIASGRPVLTDIYLTTTFGKDRWLIVSAVTFKSRAETQLLLTFSDITERKQAEEEQRALLADTERRVKQLTILHEVAILSTRVDTVDQLIEGTTEIIGGNLYPDNFGILLLEEGSDVLHVHPSYRFVSAAGLTAGDVPLGSGITGQVAQTGQSVRIGNIERFRNYIHVDPRTLSELCVPIKLKDRVLGVINTESTKTEAFSEDDELLLGTLAAQLATAIEQIRAAQAERQWLAQLAHSNDLIYAVAQIMTHIEKAITPDDIIETLGRELNRINLTCIMAAYDKDLSFFTINYTSLDSKVLEQMESAIGFPLIKHNFPLRNLVLVLGPEEVRHPALLVNGEQELQVLFPHQREEGVLEILEAIGAGQEAALLRLPLLFEDNLLGILWVWGKGIAKTDLPIMSILAKQIGISLERARLFQEVQSLALTDPLTGLHNRRSLFELGRIEFARAKRAKSAFSCLLLDLDYFKQVNDTYGHLVGDETLQEFAERVKRAVREVDLVGRYGGEEFVIFLPETDLDAAVLVAERLRSSMHELPFKVSGLELNITVSIGIATKDENTPNLQTLLARADQAMYVAKYKGRNRVAVSR